MRRNHTRDNTIVHCHHRSVHTAGITVDKRDIVVLGFNDARNNFRLINKIRFDEHNIFIKCHLFKSKCHGINIVCFAETFVVDVVQTEILIMGIEVFFEFVGTVTGDHSDVGDAIIIQPVNNPADYSFTSNC